MVRSPGTAPSPRQLLSVIVPAYNEEKVLPEFHRRLSDVLSALDMRTEIIYVNDGSSDGTLQLIRHLRDASANVTLVDLSRNFGKEAAMTAGFDLAAGDAVVVIDADLQDPPELIPDMVSQWRAGFDMVYAQRTVRDGESSVKKSTSYLFYRLIQRVSRVQIPKDTGDYRLLSRRAVVALNSLREQHRFMKGLFAWIGFPQTAIPYRRDPRFAGETKFNYWKLWNFALEGFTSFTIAPLKIATYLGIFTSMFAFLYGMYVMYKTLIYGEPVSGYPSMMVVMTFMGGAQLGFIGILGEYIGRMFNETKQRPLYFLNAYEPAAEIAPGFASSEEELIYPDDTRLDVRPLQHH
ncbi:MAG TPA: glycosyltransferase family 2 protein [Telluria sp.]